MDNTSNRLIEVFFYGLYMDEEILESKGVKPRNQRSARVDGYKLRVGKMATLLRQKDTQAFGLVYSLTHEEINKLYKYSGLTDYVVEPMSVLIENKSEVVLCCNLLNPPLEEDSNNEYFEKLKLCMKKYNLAIPKDA